MKYNVVHFFGVWLLCFGLTSIAWGQQEEPVKDPVAEEQSEEIQPIKGGVSYEPILDEKEGKLREPFKSPFELERERQEQRKKNRALSDASERLEYTIQELELKGIYFQVEKGYFAIFSVGGEYKWYQVGTKFQDGDLVNITDNEVWFKEYVEDEATEGRVREKRQVLHRGE